MRILYIHQHFSTPKGSTATRSYSMAQHLIAKGHEVVLITGRYQGGQTELQNPFIRGMRRGKVDGIELIELDISYANENNYAKRILQFLQFSLRSIMLSMRESYDVILATSTPLTVGIPGILARGLRQKKFVFEVRDLWPALPQAMNIITHPFLLKSLSFLEWACYRSAHRLIGLAPGIVEGIVAKGVDKKKVICIPNGCDLDIFTKPLRIWRPSIFLPSDFIALYAGTHGVANGLFALIEVAKELQHLERKDIFLLLVGDGQVKPLLQEKITSEGLTNIVLHPPLPKESLAGLMKSVQVGLQILSNIPAFYHGTSPNKFFDYIAAGLPVINNYPGWIANMIQETNCGIVVPPNQAKTFAKALIYAADNPSIRKTQGENAAILAKERYARTLLGAQFTTWIEGVVS